LKGTVMGAMADALAERFLTAELRSSLAKPLSLSGCCGDLTKEFYVQSSS
jgi:hypothetical protein